MFILCFLILTGQSGTTYVAYCYFSLENLVFVLIIGINCYFSLRKSVAYVDCYFSLENLVLLLIIAISPLENLVPVLIIAWA